MKTMASIAMAHRPPRTARLTGPGLTAQWNESCVSRPPWNRLTQGATRQIRITKAMVTKVDHATHMAVQNARQPGNASDSSGGGEAVMFESSAPWPFERPPRSVAASQRSIWVLHAAQQAFDEVGGAARFAAPRAFVKGSPLAMDDGPGQLAWPKDLGDDA